MSCSEFLQIDGIRAHLRSAGDPVAREAVVLLHGNPGPSDDWLCVLDEIGRFARVIAPDMPGYGQSDRPRDFDYSVPGYADFLDKLISAQSIDRVHLVLHDFGGPWGLAWAGTHAERVASFGLVNIGLMPGFKWHSLAKVWRTPLLGELFQLTTTRGMLKRALDASNPKPLPDEFIDRVIGYADWPHKRAVLKLYRATDDPGELSGPIGDVLSPRRLPAIVIWGEADPFIPSRFADLQSDYFDAEVHRLPGCGHWPMIDEPERFRSLLVPFLRRQFAAAA
jgi:pimeloyl-ACP methyl ester carboxylesterase